MPPVISNRVLPVAIPNVQPETTVTIVSGAATLSRASHLIAAETGTADSVTSFSVAAFQPGDTIKIAADAGDTITIDAAISDNGAPFDLSGAKFAFVHVRAGGAYIVSQGGAAGRRTILGQSVNNASNYNLFDVAAAGKRYHAFIVDTTDNAVNAEIFIWGGSTPRIDPPAETIGVLEFGNSGTTIYFTNLSGSTQAYNIYIEEFF